MAEVEACGTPYPSAASDDVDAWSVDVFNALSDWAVARLGTWTRWDPGYLVLVISHDGGNAIEPVTIDTADEEVTVTFGYWEAHLPEPLGTGDADAKATAEQAKRLAEDWLSGHLKTAVLTDKDGNWCASALVEPGELLPQLRDVAQRVRNSLPTSVEVRSRSRENWKTYPVDPNWLEAPPPAPLPPGRLPK